MANTKSAKKSIRVQERRRQRNVKVRTGIKTVMKKARTAIEGNEDDVAEAVKAACSAIDRAVVKGVVHKNTAARKKSRLMKRLNAKA